MKVQTIRLTGVTTTVCDDGYVHLTWRVEGKGMACLEVGADDWWWSFRGVEPGDDFVEEIEPDDIARVIELLKKASPLNGRGLA